MSLTRSSSGSQIILPSTSPRPGSAQGYRRPHDVHLDSQHQVKSEEVPKEFLLAEVVPEISKTKKSLYAVGRRSSSVPALHCASQTSSQSHTASQTSSLNPTVKDKSIPSLPKRRERRNSSGAAGAMLNDANGAVQAAGARRSSLDVSDPEEILMEAAFSNDVNMIKVLAVMDRKGLKKHVDHAMLYAILAGSVDVVKAMLKYGANPDYAAATGTTVWDAAKQSPNPEIMKDILVNRGRQSSASAEISNIFSGANQKSHEKKAPNEIKSESKESSNQSKPIVQRRAAGNKLKLFTKRFTVE